MRLTKVQLGGEGWEDGGCGGSVCSEENLHLWAQKGISRAVCTWNHWDKGVIESSGTSSLDVCLKPEGESGPLSFFAFHLQFAVHRESSPCHDSPLAVCRCPLGVWPEPTTDFLLTPSSVCCKSAQLPKLGGSKQEVVLVEDPAPGTFLPKL